ncbi:MAG: leucine-rich repeat domain-containing protein [Candidatus Berkiella sp.]
MNEDAKSENRLNQEYLEQEFAFFHVNKINIMRVIQSNRYSIKQLYENIAVMIENGFQDVTDLIELDNALIKMNAYIIIAYLNAMEDHEVEFKYITRFPSLVFKMNLNKLKIIQSLKIIGSDCYIKRLPPEIGLMTELRSLEASDCLIKNIPKEIGHLKKLEILNIDGDPIAVLPKEIGHLTQLKELHIGNNPMLTELPTEVGELVALEVLQAAHDSLKVLPEALARLAALREMNVSHNQLKKLPESLAKLSKLAVLRVDHNDIESIPPELNKWVH